MKRLAILSLIAVVLFACKKENKHEGEYGVRYVITGTNVDQFKATVDSTGHIVATPFSGTKDTTIYVHASSVIKLEAKASSHEALSGSIAVDGTQVASLTDTDGDGDSKTQIKLEYTIPVK